MPLPPGMARGRRSEPNSHDWLRWSRQGWQARDRYSWDLLMQSPKTGAAKPVIRRVTGFALERGLRSG